MGGGYELGVYIYVELTTTDPFLVSVLQTNSGNFRTAPTMKH